MAGKKKVTRVAGLTLAIALGSASMMSPVAHAQEGGPSSPATSPSSATGAPSGSASAITSTATVTTTTTAPVVTTDTSATKTTDNKQVLPKINSVVPASGGAGTSGAEYNNGKWTFTALALNPRDNHLYAISKNDNGQEAGHLLRINPKDGKERDLGPITLEGEGNTVESITAASFTSDGTLVLLDRAGKKIFTRNMGDGKTTQGGVTLKEIDRSGANSRQGSPLAWVASPDDPDALVALARGYGEPFLWTLDTTNGTAEAKKLTIAAGVDGELNDPETLEYAYTGENDTLVFADAKGHAITLKGDQVTAIAEADADDEPAANIVGITGGVASTNIVTGTVKVSSTTTTPLASTTTTTEPVTPETTTTNKQVNPQENNQPATGQKWTKDLDVTVNTSDEKVVEGARFKIEGGKVVVLQTLPKGNYRVQVQMDTAPAANQALELELTEAPTGYTLAPAAFKPEDTSVTITLPRDPSVSTTNVPNRILAGVKEAQPVVSSALKPIAAIAGLNAATGRKTTTRTTSTNTTSYTATRNTGGMSTGRTTRATSTSVRSNSTSARVVANQTATSAAVYTDSDDDGYLADTGTPMRAVISLGIISLLIGAAYLALGRRRDA